jgi:hypothetical protein
MLGEDLMDDLDQNIRLLDNLSLELTSRYQYWQGLAAQAYAATQVEDNNADELTIEASRANQQYREVFSRVITDITQVEVYLRREVQLVSERGVPLPKQIVEYTLDGNLNKYAQVTQTINQLREALLTLIQVVQAFEALEEQIRYSFDTLQSEQGRLEQYTNAQSTSAEISAARLQLEQRFANVYEPRALILQDIELLTT